MIKSILNNKLLLIAIHLVFGYLATLSLFPRFYAVLIVFSPILIIYTNKNENEEAFTFASYLVGGEVFIRMTGGLIIYETGKYGVILFLMLGVLVGRFKQSFSPHYLFYIMLLLLGIVFTQVPEGESLRTNILFNLSGPIVLGVAAFYFYKRPITKQQLYDALFFMLLPLFCMISYLYFRTPDLKEIVFNSEANFATSGGFGPNQVATAIGMGMFIITAFILDKRRISGYLFLDAIFLIYFSYRGLLTFSRGGIITAIISLVLFSILFIIHKKISFNILFKYIFVTLFFLTSVWIYTSNITGGMLENRYTGRNKLGVKEDVSSGRNKIFEIQFENFLANPLGIGVGNGKYERQKKLNTVTAASHNEVGRLLEEHGFIGFILLILLMIMPFFNFISSDFYGKAFIAAFYVIWFLTINHSAMRIALPGFIYALTLIRIYDYEDNK